MIGYGIFLGDNPCRIEKNGLYAICLSKGFAEDYAKELCETLESEYHVKKVNIEVLE